MFIVIMCTVISHKSWFLVYIVNKGARSFAIYVSDDLQQSDG